MNQEKAKNSNFRYYMRTLKTGGPMGDTANLKDYSNDFVYQHDSTCDNQDSLPRKILFMKHLL